MKPGVLLMLMLMVSSCTVYQMMSTAVPIAEQLLSPSEGLLSRCAARTSVVNDHAALHKRTSGNKISSTDSALLAIMICFLCHMCILLCSAGPECAFTLNHYTHGDLKQGDVQDIVRDHT